MIKLFLVLALASQTYESKVKDVNFDLAVEQTVQAFAPKTGLPVWWEKKIAAMSKADYKSRRKAFEDVLKRCIQNSGERRYAFWGLRDPDMEVRLWCNKALYYLYVCEECNGTGIHYLKKPENQNPDSFIICDICKSYHGDNDEAPCVLCKGEGRFWIRGVND